MNYLGLLEFHNVSYKQEGKSILDKLSISINSGDFVAITGSSGSGKSTFLKLCCQLISPTAGDIYYQGKAAKSYDPVEIRRSIAYVFQTPILFGSSVMDNILFPFTIRNQKLDLGRTAELFAMFDMELDYLDQKVVNLSGGEKQRIAIIRTLLFHSEILLLDEVTSALDPENKAIVEGVFTTLNRQGSTILWVTHDPQQGRRLANKILTVDRGTIVSLEEIK